MWKFRHIRCGVTQDSLLVIIAAGVCFLFTNASVQIHQTRFCPNSLLRNRSVWPVCASGVHLSGVRTNLFDARITASVSHVLEGRLGGLVGASPILKLGGCPGASACELLCSQVSWMPSCIYLIELMRPLTIATFTPDDSDVPSGGSLLAPTIIRADALLILARRVS